MQEVRKNIYRLAKSEDAPAPPGKAIPLSSQSGGSNIGEACGYIDRLLVAYSELSTVIVGTQLYQDAYLTTPYPSNTSNRFRGITVNGIKKSVEIGLDGIVLNINTCP